MPPMPAMANSESNKANNAVFDILSGVTVFMAGRVLVLGCLVFTVEDGVGFDEGTTSADFSGSEFSAVRTFLLSVIVYILSILVIVAIL